ncbi:signal recognition particle-docking protein FtsY [Bifidobacterium sp. ESL0732]|uniref:signal recognition particle-docking protein FtsY n=1 Tax=Bifidobacterium sp. ESL0732 TaxID=2983222 RepID=UPI0023F7FE73|nr:signal recognition particle-docking protein FtsY [Bifidobacterium sp. ESL0732]WEV64970.1 signal recognition particle-docking protein FtsY [Bifidobacterium sp. ESL0732]
MLIVVALVVVAVVLIAVAVLVSHSHKKNEANAQNANVSESAKSAEAGEASGSKDKESVKAAKNAGKAEAQSADEAGKSANASEPSKSDKSVKSSKSDKSGKAKTSDTAKSAQKADEKKAESASKEETPAKPDVETPEPKASRAIRLKEKLSKSSNPFGRVLFNILAKDQLSESDWEDVEDTLLLADVGSEASEKLVDELRNDARITGTSDPKAVREALRSKLIDLVNSQPDRALNADKPDAKKPSVIIMVGVNGTGKTTTAGKLARLFVSEGKSVMLAAADTFRAAAADQLETWGQKVGVPVVRSEKEGGDPASVAFDASKQAKEQNVDVLIIDTAGRLQNKANLMDELGKIRRVTEKNLPVDEVLLVLDAVTGQNGMAQAKVFAEAIGITGVVLSKLDGSAKGGIVISVQQELGVPVKLVGLGEGPDDLAPFDSEGFVDGILA